MKNLDSILQLINPDNTITANRALAHAIGMTETIIYSALISKYTYYESRDMLLDGRWFYCTTVDLQESTTFTKRIQKTAIDKLEEEGLISVMVTGMPARRYFSISDDIELLRSLLDRGIEKSKLMTASLRDKKREENLRQRSRKAVDFDGETEDEAEEILSEIADEASKINSGNKMLPHETTECYFKREQNVTSRGNETLLQEGTKCNLKEEQNVTSRSDKMSPQEETESHFKREQNESSRGNENAPKSKDNKSKDEETKSDQSIYLEKEGIVNYPKYTETLEQAIRNKRPVSEIVDIAIHFGFDAYPDDSEVMMLRRRIADNIELDTFLGGFMRQRVINPRYIALVREAYDVICDVVCNSRKSVKINGDSYDWEIVKAQFLRLGYDEVSSVMDRTMDYSLDIKNMKQYLITSFYNASLTEKLYETSHIPGKHKRMLKGDSYIK